MTLKEAVETDTDLDIHNFSDRQKQAVTKLLDTCHLLLNSPSLVGDRPVHEPQLMPICLCDDCNKNRAHNACNEANRVAFAKWLGERLEGLGEVLEDYQSQLCADCEPENPCKERNCLVDAVRQHFERG